MWFLKVTKLTKLIGVLFKQFVSVFSLGLSDGPSILTSTCRFLNFSLILKMLFQFFIKKPDIVFPEGPRITFCSGDLEDCKVGKY